MQKLVVFGLIFLILLIGFYYYRNYSSKKISKKVNTVDRSDLLTGLDSGGAGTTFVGGKDGEESIKMRDPSLLKNTVMSLKPLRKTTNFKFTMSGPAVGWDGKATIPIQVIRRGPNDLIGFYAQDGDRVKAVIYNINTRKKLGIRSYVGSINNVDSDKWDIEAMEGYNINTPYDMSVAIDEIKNIYPNYIREGLFYIRIAGTNLYIGGIIHKDSGLGGLSFVTTDINLDRQEFQKNSLTSFADNDGLKNRDSAMPILMDLVDGGKNDAKQEYTFTFRDIRQGRGNMKYIGIGNQNAYIVPGQKYVIVDLKSARMFYKDNNNLYTLATQWTKGNANDFYRTYMFENTGLDEINDYGSSWYIYDVDSGKYLRRKPDGAVDAVSDKNCCGKETRWYLGWNQQNSNDGYHIRTAVNMDFLRFDNNNGIIVTVSPDKHDRAFGVFREEDFHWSIYRLNRQINDIGGNNRWLWNDWGNYGITGNGILDGIDKIGFNQSGGGTPFICFSSQGGSLRGMRDGNNKEGNGGQWICTNSKNLVQNTVTPVSSLLVTNGNADKYTFFIKDNKWYMRSGDKYLSWTYLKNNRVLYLTTNAASAVPVEFEPVLTKEMALRYLQASVASLQEIRTRENRKSALSEFCGSSIMFKDGTLKVGTGLADQVATDEVIQAFERICACNMADNFYLQNTCSDQFIKDNYGITDVDQANAIRGTLKCTFSNCSFQKCRNLYNAQKNPETKLTLLADENATESSECGSSTMCIVNQTINNLGNIVGGKLNMDAKQQCGGVGSGNSVQTVTGSDYEWINITGSQSVINNQGNVSGGNVNIQQTPNSITSLPTEIRSTSQNTEFSNLRSLNEQFKIFFNTTDGNLSIIKVSDNSTVWSVKGINKFVSGVPPPYKLVQGNDGNLVVYGNQPYPVVFSTADTSQWKRGAVKTPYVTTLSNSGVLETKDGNNTVIWSSQ